MSIRVRMRDAGGLFAIRTIAGGELLGSAGVRGVVFANFPGITQKRRMILMNDKLHGELL